MKYSVSNKHSLALENISVDAVVTRKKLVNCFFFSFWKLQFWTYMYRTAKMNENEMLYECFSLWGLEDDLSFHHWVHTHFIMFYEKKKGSYSVDGIIFSQFYSKYKTCQRNSASETCCLTAKEKLCWKAAWNGNNYFLEFILKFRFLSYISQN